MRPTERPGSRVPGKCGGVRWRNHDRPIHLPVCREAQGWGLGLGVSDVSASQPRRVWGPAGLGPGLARRAWGLKGVGPSRLGVASAGRSHWAAPGPRCWRLRVARGSGLPGDEVGRRRRERRGRCSPASSGSGRLWFPSTAPGPRRARAKEGAPRPPPRLLPRRDGPQSPRAVGVRAR